MKRVDELIREARALRETYQKKKAIRETIQSLKRRKKKKKKHTPEKVIEIKIANLEQLEEEIADGTQTDEYIMEAVTKWRSAIEKGKRDMEKKEMKIKVLNENLMDAIKQNRCFVEHQEKQQAGQFPPFPISHEIRETETRVKILSQKREQETQGVQEIEDALSTDMEMLWSEMITRFGRKRKRRRPKYQSG